MTELSPTANAVADNHARKTYEAVGFAVVQNCYSLVRDGFVLLMSTLSAGCWTAP